MDEIEQRLKDASEACFNAYTSWSKDKKDQPVREALQESIHELRKIAARLEIEMAVAEGGGSSGKRIPIPAHRSSNRPNKGRGRDGNANGGGNSGDDQSGLPSFIKGDSSDAGKKPTRKRAPRKPKEDGNTEG